MIKQCSTCGEKKLKKDFYSRKTARDGLTSQCRECKRRSASFCSSRIRGTLECFKVRTWEGINRRTVNGKYPDYAPGRPAICYLRRGTELRMSREEYWIWVDSQALKILAMYANGETPSIDRINSDGHYSTDNLQILDMRENRYRGSLRGGAARYHAVTAIHLKTGEIIDFKSLTEARKLGVCHPNILACLRGDRKSAGGYQWVEKQR